MAKLTLQQRYLRALEARGYKVDRLARSTRYIVLVCEAATNTITKGPHRILLGKSGALRLTRKNLDNAFDISDRFGVMLLAEADALKDKIRIESS